MVLEGIGRFDDTRFGFCIIPICQGKLQERNFYAFVAVEPQNYKYFKEHYKSGQGSNFEAFGKEILRGWGTSPPEDILHHVSTKYNIEFGVEQSFLERLVALTEKSPFPLKPAKAS